MRDAVGHVHNSYSIFFLENEFTGKINLSFVDRSAKKKKYGHFVSHERKQWKKKLKRMTETFALKVTQKKSKKEK